MRAPLSLRENLFLNAPFQSMSYGPYGTGYAKVSLPTGHARFAWLLRSVILGPIPAARAA